MDPDPDPRLPGNEFGSWKIIRIRIRNTAVNNNFIQINSMYSIFSVFDRSAYSRPVRRFRGPLQEFDQNCRISYTLDHITVLVIEYFFCISKALVYIFLTLNKFSQRISFYEQFCRLSRKEKAEDGGWFEKDDGWDPTQVIPRVLV